MGGIARKYRTHTICAFGKDLAHEGKPIMTKTPQTKSEPQSKSASSSNDVSRTKEGSSELTEAELFQVTGGITAPKVGGIK
jgi:hypothetical protein